MELGWQGRGHRDKDQAPLMQGKAMRICWDYAARPEIGPRWKHISRTCGRFRHPGACMHSIWGLCAVEPHVLGGVVRDEPVRL